MTKLRSPYPKVREDFYEAFVYPTSSKITLPKPEGKPEADFFEVILGRKSLRLFKKLSLSEIGNILWHSSKVMEVEMLENGFLWTHRPAPSAGGRHPIDILVSLPAALQYRSACLYNPLDHSLSNLDVSREHLDTLLIHTSEILPIENATIIWFLAHPTRTSSKYENHESLVWRDAGALVYCIQIVCQAFGVNCCPLGSLFEPYLSKLFNKKDVYGVGGCLLG